MLVSLQGETAHCEMFGCSGTANLKVPQTVEPPRKQIFLGMSVIVRIDLSQRAW